MYFERMKPAPLLLLLGLVFFACSRQTMGISRSDRQKDIEMVTTEGTLVLRLSDSTPLHRDNFLQLVKSRFYDSVLFHRVIQGFMIQAGDPDSKRAAAGLPLGNGGLPYTLPAELRPFLFHKKGALAAARQGDNVNPEKRSSATQFYLVQGRAFTDAQLDSIETARLQGRKISPQRRNYYRTAGGTPQLDSNYTVFGEVVKGLAVIDKIAALETSKGRDRDRPVRDVRILKVKLVKRREG